MYASLKEWINVPYKYKSFIKYDGAGNKIYGDETESLCYPTGDVRFVTDVYGKQVVSTGQLYVPGTEPIKVSDAVIFNGDERAILRITSYYRNGVEDIKVVYL